jgi:hypothetical protein
MEQLMISPLAAVVTAKNGIVLFDMCRRLKERATMAYNKFSWSYSPQQYRCPVHN